uniref:Candidate secreted effector n=1 Tax=Meloidogyne incognita TaxID=6306 RepID=A0A914NM63_MELIC
MLVTTRRPDQPSSLIQEPAPPLEDKMSIKAPHSINSIGSTGQDQRGLKRRDRLKTKTKNIPFY